MGLLLYQGGTVCDDSFNITAAHAICKVMGFEGALQWFSGSKWPIQVQFNVVINHVKCPLPIWSTCGYINGNCGHHEDIFLTCSISESLNHFIIKFIHFNTFNTTTIARYFFFAAPWRIFTTPIIFCPSLSRKILCSYQLKTLKPLVIMLEDEEKT